MNGRTLSPRKPRSRTSSSNSRTASMPFRTSAPANGNEPVGVALGERGDQLVRDERLVHARPLVEAGDQRALDAGRVQDADEVLLAHLHAGRRAPELVDIGLALVEDAQVARHLLGKVLRDMVHHLRHRDDRRPHVDRAAIDLARAVMPPSVLGAAAIPGSFASAIAPSPSVVRCRGRAPRCGARPLPRRPCARGSP